MMNKAAVVVASFALLAPVLAQNELQNSPECENCLEKGTTLYEYLTTPFMLTRQRDALEQEVCPNMPDFGTCQVNVELHWNDMAYVMYLNPSTVRASCLYLGNCNFTMEAVEARQEEPWDCITCQTFVVDVAEALGIEEASADFVTLLQGPDYCEKYDGEQQRVCKTKVENFIPEAMPVISYLVQVRALEICSDAFMVCEAKK